MRILNPSNAADRFENDSWNEAADTIEALAAENKRLREAWVRVREKCALIAERYPSASCKRKSSGEIIAEQIRARAALGGE